MTDFVGWPKIPRINRIFGRSIITEKIDGTNAHVLIKPANEVGVEGLSPNDPEARFQNKYALAFGGEQGLYICAGSRTRWITPENDNFGFAKWVKDNAEELFKLGPGHHFGEWYGNGIQRGYGLKEKRFALFNSRRWNDQNPNRPECCECVKELHSGEFTLDILEEVTDHLKETGSQQVPGFMQPEGVVVYLSELDKMIKWTYDYTEGKWKNP